MSNEWRRSIAALADPVRRRVYVELVLDTTTSDSSEIPLKKRERALSALSNAGLIEPRSGGRFAVNETAFETLLAQESQPTKHGVERFLHRGRIDKYPARMSERRELLEWVVARSLPESEVLSEPEVNERLAPFTDDVATLRRYLVDEGLLFREPDGRSYERRRDANETSPQTAGGPAGTCQTVEFVQGQARPLTDCPAVYKLRNIYI